jgi:hypothetical protein
LPRIRAGVDPKNKSLPGEKGYLLKKMLEAGRLESLEAHILCKLSGIPASWPFGDMSPITD